MVEDYFNQIKQYGNEINLKDMFRLKFSVLFKDQPKPVERYEIHRFESNGTETGVKIVIYLGLIGLLQERKNIVGTRIRVTNRDGSTHVEEIVVWQPDQKIELQMSEFSAPLSHLATSIDERWMFDRNDCNPFVPNVRQVTAGKMAVACDCRPGRPRSSR